MRLRVPVNQQWEEPVHVAKSFDIPKKLGIAPIQWTEDSVTQRERLTAHAQNRWVTGS